jgi:phage repressor protein C with HTH and peptisase S24 domain
MPANPLTPEQLAEAAKVKSLFVGWQQRRREAREPASQEAASELLGFNQSALSQYLNGKIPLNIEAATRFATLIGCAVADFSPSLAQQVENYMSRLSQNGQGYSPTRASRISTDLSAVEMVPIKAVELRLQAGIPGFDIDHGFEDGGTINMPLEEIEKRGLVPQCLLAIQVKGESMEPMLFSGDSVVINIADTKWADQGVFAINYDGKPVIKRLSFEDRDWWMVSENPKHRRERCRLGQTIVVGRVVYRPPSWRL